MVLRGLVDVVVVRLLRLSVCFRFVYFCVFSGIYSHTMYTIYAHTGNRAYICLNFAHSRRDARVIHMIIGFANATAAVCTDLIILYGTPRTPTKKNRKKNNQGQRIFESKLIMAKRNSDNNNNSEWGFAWVWVMERVSVCGAPSPPTHTHRDYPPQTLRLRGFCYNQLPISHFYSTQYSIWNFTFCTQH